MVNWYIFLVLVYYTKKNLAPRYGTLYIVYFKNVRLNFQDAEFAPPENTQFDPRQAYLHQIFYPGRFSIQTLAKTISVSSARLI
jgi:hypothetical protein